MSWFLDFPRWRFELKWRIQVSISLLYFAQLTFVEVASWPSAPKLHLAWPDPWAGNQLGLFQGRENLKKSESFSIIASNEDLSCYKSASSTYYCSLPSATPIDLLHPHFCSSPPTEDLHLRRKTDGTSCQEISIQRGLGWLMNAQSCPKYKLESYSTL